MARFQDLSFRTKQTHIIGALLLLSLGLLFCQIGYRIKLFKLQAITEKSIHQSLLVKLLAIEAEKLKEERILTVIDIHQFSSDYSSTVEEIDKSVNLSLPIYKGVTYSVVGTEFSTLIKQNASIWKEFSVMLKKLADESTIEGFSQGDLQKEQLNKYVLQLLNLQREVRHIAVAESRQAESEMWVISTVLAFLLIITLRVYFRNLSKFFKKPIDHAITVAEQVSVGDLSSKCAYNSADEVGRLSAALDKIIDNQLCIARFAEKIGEGDFTVNHIAASENDKLGRILQEMKEKLQNVAVEERRRNWANEGLTMFAKLLRNHSSNIQELCDSIIINLSKYLNANQAALFLLNNDEDLEEAYLEIVSTYAWNRQKFIKKNFMIGEGIVGQSVLESSTILITDIPDNFISITSGLGEANPHSILIVPLKNNDNVHGVIEIASFNEFLPFEVEFVEKLAESIAATLGTVQANNKTKELLDESQEMTEHLKLQEEILRQNTEELRVSQETLNIKLNQAREGMKQQIRQIEAEKTKHMAILEGCVDGVVTFNQNGVVEFFNKAAEEIWHIKREEILGKNIRLLLPLEIINSGNSTTAYYIKDGQRRNIDVRTEVSAVDQYQNEISILLTLTEARVDEEITFTAFIQSIAVELF